MAKGDVRALAPSKTPREPWAWPGRLIFHAAAGLGRLVLPVWWGHWLVRLDPKTRVEGGDVPARWRVLDRNFAPAIPEPISDDDAE